MSALCLRRQSSPVGADRCVCPMPDAGRPCGCGKWMPIQDHLYADAMTICRDSPHTYPVPAPSALAGNDWERRLSPARECTLKCALPGTLKRALPVNPTGSADWERRLSPAKECTLKCALPGTLKCALLVNREPQLQSAKIGTPVLVGKENSRQACGLFWTTQRVVLLMEISAEVCASGMKRHWVTAGIDLTEAWKISSSHGRIRGEEEFVH